MLKVLKIMGLVVFTMIIVLLWYKAVSIFLVHGITVKSASLVAIAGGVTLIALVIFSTKTTRSK